MEDKGSFILFSQYHGCWCPDDIRTQAINSHSTDLVISVYSGFSTRRVSEVSWFLPPFLPSQTPQRGCAWGAEYPAPSAAAAAGPERWPPPGAEHAGSGTSSDASSADEQRWAAVPTGCGPVQWQKAGHWGGSLSSVGCNQPLWPVPASDLKTQGNTGIPRHQLATAIKKNLQ